MGSQKREATRPSSVPLRPKACYVATHWDADHSLCPPDMIRLVLLACRKDSRRAREEEYKKGAKKGGRRAGRKEGGKYQQCWVVYCGVK